MVSIMSRTALRLLYLSSLAFAFLGNFWEWGAILGAIGLVYWVGYYTAAPQNQPTKD